MKRSLKLIFTKRDENTSPADNADSRRIISAIISEICGNYFQMKNTIITALLCFGITSSLCAHSEHKKKKEEKPKTDTVTEVKTAASFSMQNEIEKKHEESEPHHGLQASNTFPNYHPLIVHFPIVLLLFATLFQMFSFFFYKKELSLTSLILLLFGVIAAWLSSNIFHPHTEELTERAKEILETHEQFASFTWWFSLAALLVKIISHFFVKRKLWLESVVAVLLISSAITVSIAGHHGAKLVHIEGVGPQGKFLETVNEHKY